MFNKFVTLVAVIIMVGFPPPLLAKTTAASDPGVAEAATGRTPPRLSFVQGEVSFWRPGAEDWAAARINTALEAGDDLYTGAAANLEVQVGPMAFLRAGEHTEVGLEDLEPDFLQVKVTSGHAALDVRQLDPGQAIELDTPNAAVTVERPGYYRVDVTADSTALTSRRGGHATVTPAGAAPIDVSGNQEAIIQGTETAQAATYQAPKLDDWDWWNYNRTDSLLASGSGSYLPPDMYGSQQLSQYGTWQDADPYGPVWVPNDVGSTWAPYSDGEWMWDPYYNWTWVDNAPWGWAPYHYGRWVYWNNCWAWAPGPIVASPVWAPALVGFLGFPGVSVGVGFGTPIGWVALGWGEPLWPWWGGVGFIGVPCWNGWYGPRHFHHGDFDHHREFDNMHAPHGVVAVSRDRFGNGNVERARISNVLHSAGPRGAQPIRGALPVRAGPQSLVTAAGRGIRPPARVMDRRVVATRAPRMPAVPHNPAAMRMASAMNPAPRLVPAVQRRMTATASSNLRQFPTTFGSASPRPLGTLPRENARASGPISASSRFSPPPLPRGGAALHQAAPRQYANRQGGFAFASRPGPAQVESGRPSNPADSFAPNSPRVPGARMPGLERQQGFSPPRFQEPPSPRFGSEPPRGLEPRFSQPAANMPERVFQPRVTQPRIASPRFSAPAMSAPRFAAPQAPAFRAPSAMGGARFGSGGFGAGGPGGGGFAGRVAGGGFRGAHFGGGHVAAGGFGRR
jgi:hypothetical protein